MVIRLRMLGKTICAAFAVGIFLCPTLLKAAEPDRAPVVAGMWYPSDRRALLDMLAGLERRAATTPLSLPENKTLKALIMPHAGFVYSGWTAAHAGRVLATGQFSKVFVLGPDHRVGIRHGAISDVGAYRTPLGRIPLHRQADELRAASPYFEASPASDRSEHSLEAVLPFLQYYLKSFELIPVVVGAAAPEQMAAAIEPYLDRQTLLVVSSDLSHFLTYAQARKKDLKTIHSILTLSEAELASDPDCACGRTPIRALLQLARKHAWEPVLLHYSNSGDTGGGRNRVVGYAAIAFFGEPAMQKDKLSLTDPAFTAQHGQALIDLARRSILERLGLPDADLPRAGPADPDQPCYQVRCGTFVTLKKDGRLRGCIGNFGSGQTIWSGIRRNAIKAAFEDPRFPPLTAAEAPQIKLSVSILGEPRPLTYKDGTDLQKKLRPGIDGVIIRKGPAGATFLPQVWQQLPRTDDFLSHLCRKAGLAADAWRHTRLEVYTYQVQYFEE